MNEQATEQQESRIITADNPNPSANKASTLPAPGSPIRFPIQPMTRDQFREAITLFGQWIRANAVAIVTPELEATKQNAGIMLGQFFLQYGGELLGAYETVKGEYEPLLGALLPVVGRTTNHLAQQAAAMQQAAEMEKKGK